MLSLTIATPHVGQTPQAIRIAVERRTVGSASGRCGRSGCSRIHMRVRVTSDNCDNASIAMIGATPVL